MASNQQNAIKEILSELRKGNERIDMVAKLCKKLQIGQRTFDKYLKTAKEIYLNEQQAINEAKADIIKETARLLII